MGSTVAFSGLSTTVLMLPPGEWSNSLIWFASNRHTRLHTIKDRAIKVIALTQPDKPTDILAGLYNNSIANLHFCNVLAVNIQTNIGLCFRCNNDFNR